MPLKPNKRNSFIILISLTFLCIITFAIWRQNKQNSNEYKHNTTVPETANPVTQVKQHDEIETASPVSAHDINNVPRKNGTPPKRSLTTPLQADSQTDSSENKREKTSLTSEMPPAKREILAHPVLLDLLPNSKLQIITWPTSKPPPLTVGAIVNGEELYLPKDFNKLIALDPDAPNISSPEKMAEAFIRISDPIMTKHVEIKSITPINEPDDELEYTIRVQTWTKFNGVVAEWKFAFNGNGIGHITRRIINNRTGDYIHDEKAPCPIQGTVSSWRLPLTNN